MQIIIPMSGFGERFRAVGYTVPKPLIEIDGKPIVAHVIDMFPRETNLTFICNNDHLSEKTFKMEEIILKYCDTAKIVGIDPHKLGPVHAILEIADLIDPEEPVVVNYADFTCYWVWNHFKEFVEKCKCDGAIPAYKGFHPHTLGTTNYAYLRERNGWVFDIQEKQPYTDNRMEEFASSGTYYFRSGKLMINAFLEMKEQNLNVGGEFIFNLNKLGNYKFIGIDPDNSAICIARNKLRNKSNMKFIVGCLSDFKFKNNFDAIIFRGSFQYLYKDIFKSLSLIKKLLNKKGKVFIYSLPNSNSFIYWLLKQNWSLFNPIEHKLIFSEITMRYIAKQFGFNIIELSYPYNNTSYYDIEANYNSIIDIIRNGSKKSTPFWGNIIQIVFEKK